jgi:preprotein translocase subunit YajC
MKILAAVMIGQSEVLILIVITAIIVFVIARKGRKRK